MASRDVVWVHGENLYPGWRCNYCRTQKGGGGATRLKQHLGDDGDDGDGAEPDAGGGGTGADAAAGGSGGARGVRFTVIYCTYKYTHISDYEY